MALNFTLDGWTGGGELSKKEKKKCIKLMRLDDVEWNGKEISTLDLCFQLSIQAWKNVLFLSGIGCELTFIRTK
jgi:hypothetical protein